MKIDTGTTKPKTLLLTKAIIESIRGKGKEGVEELFKIPKKQTKKTKETEVFVDQFIQKNGYPPTYRDIMDEFKLKSFCPAYYRCRHFRSKMVERS